MADVSSIAQALAYACTNLVYPNGLSAASVNGRQVIVRRGCLLPSDLLAAQSVRNNVDYITVTSTLRHYVALPEPLGRPWQPMSLLEPNVSASVAGQTVTIAVPAGVVPVGIVGIRVVSGAGEAVVTSYATQAGDTPSTIAQGLAGALPGATVSGGTLSAAGSLSAQVVGYGRSVRITRRQTQGFTISIWTSSAQARDGLGTALDESLASLGWLPTTDGTQALLSFEGAGDVDTLQTQALYRRDLRYAVTFDTLQTQVSGQMLFGGGTISIGPAGQVVSESFGDQGVCGQGSAAALSAASAAAGMFAPPSAYPQFSLDPFGTVIAAGV